MKPASLFLFLAVSLLLLAGCSPHVAERTKTSQGPTGSQVQPSDWESYLIPPEIPSTLLDYLFAKKLQDGEITSIKLKDVTDDIWALEVTTERLPNQSHSRVIKYQNIDGTWIEL